MTTPNRMILTINYSALILCYIKVLCALTVANKAEKIISFLCFRGQCQCRKKRDYLGKLKIHRKKGISTTVEQNKTRKYLEYFLCSA